MILARAVVVAACGHRQLVSIADCSLSHNESRIRRAKQTPCLRCQHTADRRAKLPKRIQQLRSAAGGYPEMKDMPKGPISIVHKDDKWAATLSTGHTGRSESPTGAILRAMANMLQDELENRE
jgi:hypothetical protein